MAFSGVIPTFQVSANSSFGPAVNQLVNGLAGGVVNVALSSQMGQQLTKVLGLPSVQSTDFLGSIVTPGFLSTGNQAITDAITGSIVNSRALGGAGGLVADLTTQIVGSTLGGLTDQLLGGLLPSRQEEATRYFPGIGGEEDANYQGFAYTPGAVGPDITFSIKPATTLAASAAKAEVTGNASGGTAVGTAATQNPTKNAPGVPKPAAVQQAVAPVTTGTTATAVSTGSSVALTAPAANPVSATANSKTSGALVGSSIVWNSAVSPSVGNSFLVNTGQFSPGTPGFFDAASLAVDPKVWSGGLKNLPFDLAFSDKLFIGAGSETPDGTEGWNFTTAPGDISWSSAAKVERVPIFGTNQPPVISGSRGMRDLTMSNSLIEGFSLGKSVESKIAKLEALLNYTLTTSYVKVPVYWVSAQDKKYGASNNDGGYFVIKDIKVKEELRDLTGNTTRATVDVSFTQVPSYQVDDGRDQASQSIAGGTSILNSVSEQVEQVTKDAIKKQSTQAQLPTKQGSSTSTSLSQTNVNKGKINCKGVLLPDHRSRKGKIEFLDKNTCQYGPPR